MWGVGRKSGTYRPCGRRAAPTLPKGKTVAAANKHTIPTLNDKLAAFRSPAGPPTSTTSTPMTLPTNPARSPGLRTPPPAGAEPAGSEPPANPTRPHPASRWPPHR
ncbi:MAG: hypothetical protein R2695_03995 [Acidimicrobiales bacterium]